MTALRCHLTLWGLGPLDELRITCAGKNESDDDYRRGQVELDRAVLCDTGRGSRDGG